MPMPDYFANELYLLRRNIRFLDFQPNYLKKIYNYSIEICTVVIINSVRNSR